MSKSRTWLVVGTIVLGVLWGGYAIFLLLRVWTVNTISLENSGLFGDSFGVFSSLFSGLALLGLLYTILQQGEELRLQREEMAKSVAAQIRQLHFSLLQLALNDPTGELEHVWCEEPATKQSFRQGAYTNLILAHWEMQFSHGLLSKAQLDAALTTYMTYPHFRLFWEKSNAHRSEMAKRDADGRSLEFHEIAEAAYNKALKPTVAPPLCSGATAA